jgi:predicted ABC-type transport system involved in lysophospholipase L1 biosynthesis ATPase subunit
VPFKQASGAEQLRVSLAMAIALNPKLRVIRIADGSLLDSDNLALVESIARENDFQVWIEMVGDGDGRGIIIEDGSVRA